LFSCANYTGKCGNKGAIMNVGVGSEIKFVQYESKHHLKVEGSESGNKGEQKCC